MLAKAAKGVFWFFTLAIPSVYFFLTAISGWAAFEHMKLHVPHAAIFWTHVLAASVALLMLPFQFWQRLRNRCSLHRWMGRIYVVAVLLGGTSGLYMAFFAMTGPVAGAGFFTLAVIWLAVTTLAYVKARARDIPAHQRWMTRSAALTFAAVTLRIYMPTSQIAGLPFEPVYTAVAWLSWVPNLIVAEWWIRSSRPTSLRVTRPV